MKMLIGGLAAMLVTTAAVGQPAPPAMEPMTNPPTAPMTGPLTAPSPVAEPAADIAPPPAPSVMAPMLVEKNGTWWNGERKATTDEIAAYKRSRPK